MEKLRLRAWDSFNETMVYSSEDYAIFILEDGDWKVKYVREKNMMNGDIEIDAPVWQESDELEIMLCTGVKDRYGKYIYEGDIAIAADGSISEIKYGPWEFEYRENENLKVFGIGFHWATGEPFSIPANDKSYKVVGNVYQNSESIKLSQQEKIIEPVILNN